MSDIHPQDKLDALDWALQQLRFRAPQGGYQSQLDRNRLHTLEQLRDEAQRKARG
ncbi:hypothetical protein [Marilutibacter spongiae]|uniref:Uncharacterized protein n=1 Tax=Marilutibacter spongiae TaxID=2025720 RepID=A0A7W3TL69_9GAMM|nr:hypothetical protein [Lysobacter spongiae]MBB1060380.1 hypothetical protein [Lysobacter spongiae]